MCELVGIACDGLVRIMCTVTKPDLVHDRFFGCFYSHSCSSPVFSYVVYFMQLLALIRILPSSKYYFGVNNVRINT